MKFPSPPDPPKPPDPVRIPSPDDPELIAGRRRRQREFLTTREGRASTELSGDSQSYSRTTLG